MGHGTAQETAALGIKNETGLQNPGTTNPALPKAARSAIPVVKLPGFYCKSQLLQGDGASKIWGVVARTLGFLKFEAQGFQILTGPYLFFL